MMSEIDLDQYNALAEEANRLACVNADLRGALIDCYSTLKAIRLHAVQGMPRVSAIADRALRNASDALDATR